MLILNVFFGTCFGAFIAFIYFFVRWRGLDGGLTLFALGAGLVFLGHLVVWPRDTLAGLKDTKILIRAILFGITQVFLLKAQSNGNTSAVLVASTMGSVFGILAGRIFLKEKLEGLAFLAILSTVAAVFLNPILILSSYLGIIGGLIQGSSLALSRHLMIEKKSIRRNISTGYGIATLIAVPILMSSGTAPLLQNISILDVIVTAGIAALVQYFYFFLCKRMDAPRIAILALSRIPWAIAIEYVILRHLPTQNGVVAGALIVLSTVLLIADASRRAATLPVPRPSPL